MSESEQPGHDEEYTECAICGYEPDPDRIPPHYVLSLDEDDISAETVESYPFGGSMSVRFACSDECWLDAREQPELVTDGGTPEHDDEHTRWSDWSQIKQYREQGKGKIPYVLKRRRKVKQLRAQLEISKHEAQQRLRYDDGIEVADHEVDGRPAALRPEVTAGD